MVKDRTEESKYKCKKKSKWMFVYFYLKNSKKDYYANNDISNLTDSEEFWRTVEPTFGRNIKSRNRRTS